MRPFIRIIGQGLAGTALAWECERTGMEFQIVDRGNAGSASSAAAGVINPVTGQRFVKSWRVDELLPLALEFYRDVERRLGLTLLEPLRGWRIFRNETEATRYASKHERGELAPYDRGPLERSTTEPWCVAAHGSSEFGEVWRLDVARCLAASRERWKSQGFLIEQEFPLPFSEGWAETQGPPGIPSTPAAESPRENSPTPPITIFCTGAALADALRLSAATPVRCAHGEIAELRDARVPPATMINARHWFLPLADGRVLAGASYRVDGAGSEDDGAAELSAAAAEVLRAPGSIASVRSGVRLVAGDKLPIAGWLDPARNVGVCSALGSKGSYFAPWLARQWCEHVRDGKPFAREIRLGRDRE